MATYETTVTTPRPPQEAFAYMADMGNFGQWDPSVRGVEQIEGDGGGAGAVFDVTVHAFRRDVTLRYHTVEYEAPRRVRLRAATGLVHSDDLITIRAGDGGEGSVVTYRAELGLKGLARIATPLLGPFFDRLGDRAAAGLRGELDAR